MQIVRSEFSVSWCMDSIARIQRWLFSESIQLGNEVRTNHCTVPPPYPTFSATVALRMSRSSHPGLLRELCSRATCQDLLYGMSVHYQATQVIVTPTHQSLYRRRANVLSGTPGNYHTLRLVDEGRPEWTRPIQHLPYSLSREKNELWYVCLKAILLTSFGPVVPRSTFCVDEGVRSIEMP